MPRSRNILEATPDAGTNLHTLVFGKRIPVLLLKCPGFLFSQFPYAVVDCRGAKKPAEGVPFFETLNLFLNIQNTNFSKRNEELPEVRPPAISPQSNPTPKLYIKKLKEFLSL